MKARLMAASAMLLVPVVPAHADEARPGCVAALQSESRTMAPRTLRAEDLVRLRDIGSNIDNPIWAGVVPRTSNAIALSPDRTKLAFEMRRADPAGNTICQGMFVIAQDRGGAPIQVDEGGDLIRFRFDNFRGMAGFPSGFAIDRLPRWTSDGKAILFLKQTGGAVQVWRAQVDGSDSRPVTRSPDDVVDFRIAADDSSIVYKTQPKFREGLNAINAEGLQGLHYDGRFSPMTSNRPFVPGPLPYLTWIQADAPAAVVRPASKEEEALFGWGMGAPSTAMAAITSPGHDVAWLAIDGEHYPPRMKLSVRLADGKVLDCAATTCPGDIADMWWSTDGRLRFMHREGWDREATAIYEWSPGRGVPKRIFTTNDVLAGCVPDSNDLICLRDGSLRPRYIDRIDLASGKDIEIFDPNPEFHALALGKVERLHWRNTQGLEAFGDLVLPVGYEPGKRYPLIVVQYESRGFLRGGTGDEYPIQLFAAHGFAVLSVNHPPDVGSTAGSRTLAEAQRRDSASFADRRSIQSAIEVGVKLVVDRGIADPDRLGITGLSDGASAVNFALINSHLFKAAAFSSCCWDSSLAIAVGPGAMALFADRYPSVLSDSNPFWDPISVAKNAAHLDVPMLIQVSDGEMLGALTAITALRDKHQPADMYVFPGEYHVKWQPAHRLAVYRRDLAWFQFWFGDRGAIDAPKDELARWAVLRDERAGQGSGG